MRCVWVTDIHLDHALQETRSNFYDDIQGEEPDCIFITGDIASAKTHRRFLLDIAEACPSVDIYFVLGNHDFYGADRSSTVRKYAARIMRDDNENVIYLPQVAPLFLDNKTALIGVDGVGDAKNGNWMTTPVVLNDFNYIPELAGKERIALSAILNRQGEEEAKTLLRQLKTAKNGDVDTMIVLTHVPPYPEAAWYEGKMSAPDFQPYFSCKSTGDVLLSFARKNPSLKTLVLCGHSHGGGVFEPLDNLTVITGPAKYRYPEIQKVFEL